MQVAEAPMHETKKRDHEVRIHIDRHPYESPNLTTGAALYVLGKVPAGHQLYREARGDKEDEPIHNDAEREHLTPDEHFYSEEERHKGFDIVVNAEQHHLEKKHASYEHIVKLAYPLPPPVPAGHTLHYTVTYYDGPKTNPEGVLTAGESVKIKNRMIFNVKATYRS